MEQMINVVIDLAVTWWQFTVVGILIAVGFIINMFGVDNKHKSCLLYTSPSPRDATLSRMPSSA